MPVLPALLAARRSLSRRVSFQEPSELEEKCHLRLRAEPFRPKFDGTVSSIIFSMPSRVPW
eukprot:4801575-Amphidinium_carterae.1